MSTSLQGSNFKSGENLCLCQCWGMRGISNSRQQIGAVLLPAPCTHIHQQSLSLRSARKKGPPSVPEMFDGDVGKIETKVHQRRLQPCNLDVHATCTRHARSLLCTKRWRNGWHKVMCISSCWLIVHSRHVTFSVYLACTYKAALSSNIMCLQTVEEWVKWSMFRLLDLLCKADM